MIVLLFWSIGCEYHTHTAFITPHHQVLEAYLSTCFLPSTNPPPPHVLPPPSTIDKQQHLSVIETLPDVDPPAAFGLPANATQLLQLAEGHHLIQSIKQLDSGGRNGVQPAVYGGQQAGSGNTTSNGCPPAVTAFIRMWTATTRSEPELLQLPAHAGTLAQQQHTTSTTKNNPLAVFVAREASIAAQLLTAIQTTVNELQRWSNDSTVTLTPVLAAIVTALAADHVPAAWSTVWDGHGVEHTPGAYCAAFVRRAMGLDQLQALLTGMSGGSAGGKQHPTVDMSLLFAPGALLAALRQDAATRLAVPADELALVAGLRSGGTGGQASTVALQGLLLRGARIENGRLMHLDAGLCVVLVVLVQNAQENA